MPAKTEEIPWFKYSFEDIPEDVAEGHLWKRHVDHVKEVAGENEMTPPLELCSELPEPEPTSSPVASVPERLLVAALEGNALETPEEPAVNTPLGNTRVPSLPPPKQYSSRARKPPDRYLPHNLWGRDVMTWTQELQTMNCWLYSHVLRVCWFLLIM